MSTDFRKNPRISNFKKIRPVKAEFLQADGQIDGRSDMTKLGVTFRDFRNAPKSYTPQCAGGT